MNHMDWKTIMAGLERGERPSHLDECETCRAKWARTESMLLALRPPEEPGRDLADLTRRILAGSAEPRARWVPSPRWAWALLVPLCLAGAGVVWHQQERSLERRYAAIMEGRLGEVPGGLDGLLPQGWISSSETWMDDWFVSVDDGKGE